MLEMIFAQNAASPMMATNPTDPKMGKFVLVFLIIYLAIWIWALTRAVKCRPATKVMHVFFASVSPTLYLLFSYFSKGFCN